MCYPKKGSVRGQGVAWAEVIAHSVFRDQVSAETPASSGRFWSPPGHLRRKGQREQAVLQAASTNFTPVCTEQLE